MATTGSLDASRDLEGVSWDASGFVPGAFKFAANITQAVTSVNTGATVELVGYAFTDIMPLEAGA